MTVANLTCYLSLDTFQNFPKLACSPQLSTSCSSSLRTTAGANLLPTFPAARPCTSASSTHALPAFPILPNALPITLRTHNTQSPAITLRPLWQRNRYFFFLLTLPLRVNLWEDKSFSIGTFWYLCICFLCLLFWPKLFLGSGTTTLFLPIFSLWTAGYILYPSHGPFEINFRSHTPWTWT